MGPREPWPLDCNPRTREAAEERALAALRRGLLWAALVCAILAGTMALSSWGLAP